MAERADAQRVLDLFELVVDVPPIERDARLRAAGADTALCREVLDLLAAAAHAPRFLDDPLLGLVVPPYVFGERLGAGGMGVVHRGVRRGPDGLEIPVALKVVRADLADAARPMFEAEWRTLRALQHPHIVALQDVGVLPDGRPFLVTELVDGTPIDAWVAQRRLAPRAVVELVAAVCRAIAHAHRHLIVHCDLKPAHVLVTDDGVPKLLDFGIAQLLGADDARRPFTPAYASPEQLRGDPVTVASDVHALGVLLRELLADGGDTDLRAILRRATAEEADHRYPTTEALQHDLLAWLSDAPVAARGGGLAYRAARLWRRHRLAIAAGAVALAALATLLLRVIDDARAEAGLGWGAHAQAVATSNFLADLLRETRGLDAGRYREALDRAAAAVGTRFTDHPETEGRIRLALAQLELDLGRPTEAAAHATRAAALIATHRGFGRADRERAAALLREATR